MQSNFPKPNGRSRPAVAGETVLLKQGSSTRWVRVVHAAAPAMANGRTTQLITVQAVDMYGRAKPKLVKLGSGASIEWVA